MMQVRSSVKFSPIHGIGCFAEEDIKQGQVVWEFDARLDLIIPYEELSNFPESTVEFLKMYSYTQNENGHKTLILCGDHGRHMNHSEKPNLLEESGPQGRNIAARDIKKGEEFTCDYSLFDLDVECKLNQPL